MHIKVMGSGADLVMLHGWSMHSAVWSDLAEALAENYTLHLVDLPGHGQSDWQHTALDLDVLINNLANELPMTAYWLGWSLGGLISIAFAAHLPARVKKLVLLAATPCFVKATDWTCAMDESVFKAFANDLKMNQAKTLQRFLLLQAYGLKHSPDTIRQLGKRLALEKPPNTEALQAGLTLLIATDMRVQFSELACPVKMILGDRDSLIPKEMLLAAQQVQPELKTTLLTGTGHAPFIAQSKQCQQMIEQFLND